MSKLNKFTTFAIANLVKAGERGLNGDGGGLYLQITGVGKASWLFRYKFAGRERNMGLGSYPLVGVAEARQKRDEARKLLVNGIDPLEARNAAALQKKVEGAAAVTVGQCAEMLFAANEKRWVRTSRKHILWILRHCQLLNELPVKAIDTTMANAQVHGSAAQERGAGGEVV